MKLKVELQNLVFLVAPGANLRADHFPRQWERKRFFFCN